VVFSHLKFQNKMGYVKHNAIIVTGNSEDILKAHSRAVQIFDVEFSRGVLSQKGSILITPVVGGYVNDEFSFLIAPDGLKEGWPSSDYGDNARASFLGWLRSEEDLYLDFVEVAFGGDFESADVITHKDAR